MDKSVRIWWTGYGETRNANKIFDLKKEKYMKMCPREISC